ncbi:MAG: hypothetical protein KI792_08775 [Alphaproteobacteria bacterium]|nr:hypothetical protein [Alphaproteobacteria bacterium SS10]
MVLGNRVKAGLVGIFGLLALTVGTSLGLLGHDGRPTQAQACGSPVPAAMVNVEIIPWNVRYDYTRSQAELSALVQRQTWLSNAHSARGLYESEIMHRHRLVFHEEQGGWLSSNCLAVAELGVQLTYHRPTIYLAKELAWARCVAVEVRRHEEKHARVDREMMDWMRAYTEGEVTKWLSERPVQKPADIQLAKAEIDRELKAVIERAVQVFAAERNKRQLAVDTPQEYQRIEDACPNN